MTIENHLEKLGTLIVKLIENNKIEQAITVSKLLAYNYYDYNQKYTDTILENNLIVIREKILTRQEYIPNKKCVLFYDGFGLDLRGWAASYMRAFSKLNYFVVYICPQSSQYKIPHIVSELDQSNIIIYIEDRLNNIDKIQKINNIFEKYRPGTAFFYTKPDDVDAAIAFSNNESATRFQIDLTDHAYWIGVNAFDYIIDGREMGASIAYYERKISRDKIIKLDCVPYINKDKYDDKLPFDIYKEQYVFTGGALYKTLGDSELLYYKTINDILCRYPKIKFLYAGSGDETEIKKIISKYPQRAFLIPERPDFYDLIKNCVLYINSYPMFGGLMMRYAALAGKIPITLKHDNDSDGILFNQSELGIEYDNYRDYMNEIYNLLEDDNYRKQKEKLVSDSVMSEEDFFHNLDMLIKSQKTEYSFEKIDRFDTSEFRKEYKKRYSKKTLYKTVAQKQNIGIIKYLPIEFFVGGILRVKEKLCK